jgi:hypothetical protein
LQLQVHCGVFFFHQDKTTYCSCNIHAARLVILHIKLPSSDEEGNESRPNVSERREKGEFDLKPSVALPGSAPPPTLTVGAGSLYLKGGASLVFI